MAQVIARHSSFDTLSSDTNTDPTTLEDDITEPITFGENGVGVQKQSGGVRANSSFAEEMRRQGIQLDQLTYNEGS